MRQNEAFNVKFTIFNFEVIQGHLSSKSLQKVERVKFRSFQKLVKFYGNMKILTKA